MLIVTKTAGIAILVSDKIDFYVKKCYKRQRMLYIDKKFDIEI